MIKENTGVAILILPIQCYNKCKRCYIYYKKLSFSSQTQVGKKLLNWYWEYNLKLNWKLISVTNLYYMHMHELLQYNLVDKYHIHTLRCTNFVAGYIICSFHCHETDGCALVVSHTRW